MRRGNLPTVAVVAAGLLAAGAGLSAQQPRQAKAGRLEIPLGLDQYMPVPATNPLTVEKVALGRKLFRERLLSRDRSLACATCHDPKRAFTDPRATSVGVFNRKGSRNAPALINRGYGAAFFWDGRASTLEEQALKPIQNPKEMDMKLDEVMGRLRSRNGYRRLFLRAFGREANADDLARALASYLRTILSGDAPVDRYYAGGRQALSEQARQGLEIFRGKGNCTACHLGPNFTDERFHNTGAAWRQGTLRDEGRFAVTGREADRGAFKTPTLREVVRTAPYMHDGSLASLEDVIEFYNRGGNPNPHLDREIHPLHLTAGEKQALLAFLKSLNGNLREARLK